MRQKFGNKFFLQAVLLALVTILLYWQALKADFVWDDTSFVLRWPEIQQFEQHVPELLKGNLPPAHTGVYRPVRSIAYGIAYNLGQAEPEFHHAFVLMFHLLNVILVFLFVWQLL